MNAVYSKTIDLSEMLPEWTKIFGGKDLHERGTVKGSLKTLYTLQSQL